MTKTRRTVTIAIHTEGDPESRLYRLPSWLFRTLLVGSVVFVALVAIAAVLYTPIVQVAARVPGLNREIARLTEENNQVTQLAATLEELEARYAQVRTVLGAEIVPAQLALAQDDHAMPLAAFPVVARVPGSLMRYPDIGATLPVYWPIDSLVHGVITRGFTPEAEGAGRHPGVDIAVPRGTAIRAAGGGRVDDAGFDPEYGLFVLIDHPDGYRSMYGHASRILVAAGDSVSAGQVIALSGSTGRSTAPHLHFEKRRGDLLVDPRETLSEGS